jgi:hypothetical protein
MNFACHMSQLLSDIPCIFGLHTSRVFHPAASFSSGSSTESFIMRTSDKFPWELLKAECLRLVCAQLVEGSNEGQNSFKPGRKEDMVAFLRDVHERGGNSV